MEDTNKVYCAVCGQVYIDWAGSTPCCGSVAFSIDSEGNRTESVVLYGYLVLSPHNGSLG